MNKTVRPSPLMGSLPILPSKSASHRAVMMAAMAQGKTVVSPIQLSNDIRATLACANALGLARNVRVLPAEGSDFVEIDMQGGGEPQGNCTLDCGESGSTLRFFIPLALCGQGPVTFVGHGRLMQRPLDLYAQLFAPRGIRFEQQGDTLTVDGMLESGTFELRGDVSSQFITGLLLALPRLRGESVLEITTPLQSRAYVELTQRIQVEFGVVSHWENNGQRLIIPGFQRIQTPETVHVEGDWSHAAFYLVAGCIGRGPITLYGLDPKSTQGDRAVCDILRKMGADIRETDGAVTSYPSKLHDAVIDCAQVPDLVPVLAVAMAAAEGESRIINAERLRIKESDRLAAMHAALTAAGGDAVQTPDGLVIRGGKKLHEAAIDGCNDHRIVMAMAVASALSSGALTISDAEATAKSAPAFWQEFERLGGRAQ